MKKPFWSDPSFLEEQAAAEVAGTVEALSQKDLKFVAGPVAAFADEQQSYLDYRQHGANEDLYQIDLLKQRVFWTNPDTEEEKLAAADLRAALISLASKDIEGAMTSNALFCFDAKHLGRAALLDEGVLCSAELGRVQLQKLMEEKISDRLMQIEEPTRHLRDAVSYFADPSGRSFREALDVWTDLMLFWEKVAPHDVRNSEEKNFYLNVMAANRPDIGDVLKTTLASKRTWSHKLLVGARLALQ